MSDAARPSEGEGNQTRPRSTPSGRRTTRNTQPSHHLKNLLVREEEDGGISSTARPSEGEGNKTRRPSPGGLVKGAAGVVVRERG